MNKVKPEIRLVNADGNAWSIMGRASDALEKAGYSRKEVSKYYEEARSGDYGNLLRVTMKWCECDPPVDDDKECDNNCGVILSQSGYDPYPVDDELICKCCYEEMFGYEEEEDDE